MCVRSDRRGRRSIEGNIDNFVVDRFCRAEDTDNTGRRMEGFKDSYWGSIGTVPGRISDTGRSLRGYDLVIETAEDTSSSEKAKTRTKRRIKMPGRWKRTGQEIPMNKLKNRMAAVTGDEARPMLYVLAAIAADEAAVVISVTVIRRKINK